MRKWKVSIKDGILGNVREEIVEAENGFRAQEVCKPLLSSGPFSVVGVEEIKCECECKEGECNEEATSCCQEKDEVSVEAECEEAAPEESNEEVEACEEGRECEAVEEIEEESSSVEESPKKKSTTKKKSTK